MLAYILAWSVLVGGFGYGMRVVFLENGKERFARGVYRDDTSRF
jgi:hypothetical protein